MLLKDAQIGRTYVVQEIRLPSSWSAGWKLWA